MLLPIATATMRHSPLLLQSNNCENESESGRLVCQDKG